MRVLAVDDEPYFRELIPMLMARLGFPEVVTAPSGQLALAALVEGSRVFDCILLDINMPEMDGIEVCRRIRQIVGYSKTPIIMLTAASQWRFMDAAFRAGASDYVAKPLDLNELGKRLKNAQELVAVVKEAQMLADVQPAVETAATHAHAFAVSETIAIMGVEGLIDLNAFRNYLSQSLRAGLTASQVIGVTIDRIERVYSIAQTDDFRRLLGEVADVVQEVLKTKAAMTTYAGAGLFLSVSKNVTPLSSREIEADVQYLLDERNCNYASGAPMDIEVSVGDPVPASLGRVAEVPGIIQRATALAKDRSAAKQDMPRVVNIRRFALMIQ